MRDRPPLPGPASCMLHAASPLAGQRTRMHALLASPLNDCLACFHSDEPRSRFYSLLAPSPPNFNEAQGHRPLPKCTRIPFQPPSSPAAVDGAGGSAAGGRPANMRRPPPWPQRHLPTFYSYMHSFCGWAPARGAVGPGAWYLVPGVAPPVCPWRPTPTSVHAHEPMTLSKTSWG